ncbi:MAG: hypothetical protein F9K43_05575 [Bauldia sp.]|nr:MAG: hypothetical protein F9K43_05575 [Bauldia sp.]
MPSILKSLLANAPVKTALTVGALMAVALALYSANISERRAAAEIADARLWESYWQEIAASWKAEALKYEARR